MLDVPTVNDQTTTFAGTGNSKLALYKEREKALEEALSAHVKLLGKELSHLRQQPMNSVIPKNGEEGAMLAKITKDLGPGAIQDPNNLTYLTEEYKKNPEQVAKLEGIYKSKHPENNSSDPNTEVNIAEIKEKIEAIKAELAKVRAKEVKEQKNNSNIDGAFA